jgi:hypothetical protein
MGGNVARVRRYFYTCPLNYTKWATLCGQWNSSWARCSNGRPLKEEVLSNNISLFRGIVLPGLNSLSTCHEDIWGSGGIAPPFLTSALDGGEWSTSHPCCFTPGETALGTHCVGGWVGRRAGLDTRKKRRISYPCWESNLDSLVVQPTA